MPDIEQNIKINCSDCGEAFTFTVAEQKFYAEKGFLPPKRCRFCRTRRKNEQYKRERREKYGY